MRVIGRAADSAHHLHFLRILREDWGEHLRGRWHVRGRWKKAFKNSILWNLHRGKAIRTQCDKDEA